MKAIVVWTDPETHKAVKRLALENDTSMSDIVRDLLRQRLAATMAASTLRASAAGSTLTKTT